METWIPLPKINPSWWSLLGLAISLSCLYVSAADHKAILVFCVLVTDWLDGATARRHNDLTSNGYIVDVVADRFSEAFIFIADIGRAIGVAFFVLFAVNIVLTLWSAHDGKHLVLPLRAMWIGVLVIESLR